MNFDWVSYFSYMYTCYLNDLPLEMTDSTGQPGSLIIILYLQSGYIWLSVYMHKELRWFHVIASVYVIRKTECVNHAPSTHKNPLTHSTSLVPVFNYCGSVHGNNEARFVLGECSRITFCKRVRLCLSITYWFSTGSMPKSKLGLCPNLYQVLYLRDYFMWRNSPI